MGRASWIVQTNVEAESTSPGLLRKACAELGFATLGVRARSGPRCSGADLLNAGARTLSFDELLASDYAPNTALFVRPYDDSKRFTGQTLRFSGCAELYVPPERRALDTERAHRVRRSRFNGSRFYEADVSAILRAVSTLQEEIW